LHSTDLTPPSKIREPEEREEEEITKEDSSPNPAGIRSAVEDLSQEAIEGLVNKSLHFLSFPSFPYFSLVCLALLGALLNLCFRTLAFETLGAGETINFEQFRAFALTDPTIVGWFEALGSVF